MDKIQKELIKLGRKDLAEEYYNKVSGFYAQDAPHFHNGKFHGWSNVEKEYAKSLVEDLKVYNVKAKTGRSPLVNQKMLLIHQDDFSKAIKALKKQGDKNIVDELKAFQKAFGKEYKLK